MFVIAVAAELPGGRRNTELAFAELPTVAELMRRVNDLFGAAARAALPPASHRHPLGWNASDPTGWRCVRLSVYDDEQRRWEPLLSSAQLREWGQLYAFHAREGDGSAHADDIPDCSAVLDRLPRQGARVGVVDGVSPEERMRRAVVVFTELDNNEKGYLIFDDFRRALQAPGGGGLVDACVYDLFHQADADGDGRCDWPEWAAFCELQPRLLGSLYHRTREWWAQGREEAEERAAERRGEADARAARLRAQEAAAEHHRAVADAQAAELRMQQDRQRAERRRSREAAVSAEHGRAAADAATEEARLLHQRALVEHQAEEVEEAAARFRRRHGRDPGGHAWRGPGVAAAVAADAGAYGRAPPPPHPGASPITPQTGVSPSRTGGSPGHPGAGASPPGAQPRAHGGQWAPSPGGGGAGPPRSSAAPSAPPSSPVPRAARDGAPPPAGYHQLIGAGGDTGYTDL